MRSHPALAAAVVLSASIGVVVAVLVVVHESSAPVVATGRPVPSTSRSQSTSTDPTLQDTTTTDSTSTLPPTTTTAAPVQSTGPPGSSTTAGVAATGCAPVTSLNDDQLAHLVVMVSVDGSSIGPAQMLSSGVHPLGGIFIGGNADRILADGSLARLVQSTHVIVAVDDEGGRVQRIDQLDGPLPTAAAMGSMTPDAVRHLGRIRGTQLRRRGVTVDFAPVVDLAAAAPVGVIGDRSFGTDPDVVLDRARAFADGLRDAGVVPTFKHFPGHGRAVGDSHKAVVTTPPLGELERSDLLPYQELAGAGSPTAWVMMGHLDVPGLTEPGRPASLSPAAYSYLRNRIGFRGLVVTDELGGMKAVSSRFSAGQAAVLALGAGADVLLYASVAQVDPAANAVVAAVRRGEVPRSRLIDAATSVRRAQGC